MPTLVENLLGIGIIVFVLLMIWSKMQHQRMIDTLNEIKLMLIGKQNG